MCDVLTQLLCIVSADVAVAAAAAPCPASSYCYFNGIFELVSCFPFLFYIYMYLIFWEHIEHETITECFVKCCAKTVTSSLRSSCCSVLRGLIRRE